MRLLILDTVLCYNGSEQQSEHGMTNPVIIPDIANEGATVLKIADEAFAAFNSDE